MQDEVEQKTILQPADEESAILQEFGPQSIIRARYPTWMIAFLTLFVLVR